MKLVKIPQDAVSSAADMMRQLYADQPDYENTFEKIIAKIEKFKEAELTPMVLMDPTDGYVYVVAEETFMKKLH